MENYSYCAKVGGDVVVVNVKARSTSEAIEKARKTRPELMEAGRNWMCVETRRNAVKKAVATLRRWGKAPETFPVNVNGVTYNAVSYTASYRCFSFETATGEKYAVNSPSVKVDYSVPCLMYIGELQRVM